MVIGLFNASWNSLAMITLRRGGRYVRRWRPKPENEKKFRGLKQSAPMQVTRRSAGGETPLQHHAGSIIVEPIMNIVARVGSLTHPSLTFSECSLVRVGYAVEVNQL